MKKISLIIILSFLSSSIFSQINLLDSVKVKQQVNQVVKQFKDTLGTNAKNIIVNKINEQEATWDNGIPIIPDDERIMDLIYQLDQEAITDVKKLTKDQVRIYRELGVEFYNKGMYQEADFYLSKIKNFTEIKGVKLKDVFTDNTKEIREQIKKELDEEYQQKINDLSPEKPKELTKEDERNIQKDKDFIKNLPKKIENISKDDLEKLSQQIESQIQKLKNERNELVKNKGSQDLIDSKDASINSLKKEKQVIDLNIDKEELKEEKTILTRWLWGTGLTTAVLILSIFVFLQRKTIKSQDVEIETQLKDIAKKNTYLEHAARIIRHDMHSGINTYIPRGINSLEKRISQEELQRLKIDGSVKMIKEGLNHTQKVYKSVYEFTNLVKQDVVLEKKESNLTELLKNYFDSTSYGNQVEISNLSTIQVNPILFCNAIDNLVKNGLKYNNSETKSVKIYQQGNHIFVQDNGIGMTQKQFEKLSIDFLTKENKDLDKEVGGLGLNICQTILSEHGFTLKCEKNEIGTKMTIGLV